MREREEKDVGERKRDREERCVGNTQLWENFAFCVAFNSTNVM
jgi:hypothetical protein